MRSFFTVAAVAALIALAALVPVAAIVIAPLVFAGVAVVTCAAKREEEESVGIAPALRAITVAQRLPRAGLLPIRS